MAAHRDSLLKSMAKNGEDAKLSFRDYVSWARESVSFGRRAGTRRQGLLS